MTPQRLAVFLEELLNSPAALREAGENATRLALPDAAKKVAQLAEGLASYNS
jgi:UDP-N-acetylglucosamine:LPS N-acetylglucosamine transferase